MAGLTWTREAPAVAGWYWHRAMKRDGTPEPGNRPRLVEVREMALTHPEGLVLFRTRGLVALATYLREWDEWAGPIEAAPPMEPVPS